jgi:hypothetical protein
MMLYLGMTTDLPRLCSCTNDDVNSNYLSTSKKSTRSIFYSVVYMSYFTLSTGASNIVKQNTRQH